MTIEQIQCLLKYLGYYTGNVDGIWGRQSAAALSAFFEAYGLGPDVGLNEANAEILKKAVAGLVEPVEQEKIGWDGIKHFTKDEFKCKCGGKYCNGFPVEMEMKLVLIADEVREHFGKPMIVSSGIRCDTHNAKVGGVANSRHKFGKAMDFCVSGIPSSIVLPYVQSKTGVNYAYAIDGSYVHMDVK